MNKKTQSVDERNEFYNRISQPHRRVDPCFMTGKGCVYTETIDREIYRRKDKFYSGFMVVPFQPNINTFFELCLKPYLKAEYSEGSTDQKRVDLLRADQIRRTGYVICEKICKKIQESDFIVVDISVPNPNVFYELGLSYGMNQKIIVIHQKEGSEFGEKVANYLKDAGCKAYPYEDLNQISSKDFPLSEYIWQHNLFTPIVVNKPTMLLVEKYSRLPPEQEPAEPIPVIPRDIRLNLEIYSKSISEQETIEPTSVIPQDIRLNFNTHVESSIRVAINNILKELHSKQDSNNLLDIYKKQIEGLKEIETVKKDARFKEICDQVQKAFCLLIRTGGSDCDPMAYFWFGYCHAIGKNVIPITVINKAGDKIDDLAFDIRALWHMTFIKNKPTLLADELEETLYQMIVTDFAEWSRKRFWDVILGRRGKVSIFTGALHSEDFGREMIGDWDLRAASELTSYFASHQYRATIETPLYQLDQVVKGNIKRDDYINELTEMLQDKNCIIIASPDVNPLTEIVLGKIYGIEQNKWFSPFSIKKYPHVIVAIKQKIKRGNKSLKTKTGKLSFYREEEVRGEYLFNWNDVPKNDSKRLIKHLYDNLKIDWVRKAEIKKSDNGKTITVTNGKNSLRFELNEEEYKAILEISGGETQEYILEKEKGKLNIHKRKPLHRGFISHALNDGEIMAEFVSQEDREKEFIVHAHLLIASNPFCGNQHDNKYIIIFNGMSGPATFALTHVLTGGVTKGFVSYEPEYLFSWNGVSGNEKDSNDNKKLLKFLKDDLEINWVEKAEIKKSDNGKNITVTNGKNSLRFELNEEEDKAILEISGGKTHEYILKKENGKLNIHELGFNPKSESEKILQEIIKEGSKEESTFTKRDSSTELTGLQYIIEVTVGPPIGYRKMTGHLTFDWRHIRRWKLLGDLNAPQFNIKKCKNV